MIFDEIWRMRRRENKLARAYLRMKERLRRNHNEEHIGQTLAEAEGDLCQIEMEIMFAESQALTERAQRLKVPLPERTDESWNSVFDHQCLTPKGYSDLRSKIRQEQKERRETMIAIMKDIVSPIGSLIISILSLLIAYAALKLKH